MGNRAIQVVQYTLPAGHRHFLALTRSLTMHTKPLGSPTKISLIGSAALDWLSTSETAEVVAAMSQALYLRSAQNELCWVTGPLSPMHRRALRLSSPLPSVEVGAILNTRNRIIRLDKDRWLDFIQTPTWNMPQMRPGAGENLPEIKRDIKRFYRHLLEIRPPAGLGRLVPAILTMLAGGAPDVQFDEDDIFLEAGWKSIKKTITSLMKKDYLSLPEVGLSLVGLGGGLTPSGDDLLGGMFFALAQLEQIHPSLFEQVKRTYAGFITLCAPLTNEISYTLMRDHTLGHSLQPLHAFNQGLLEGRAAGELLPYARGLISVGSSTGWDLLTGYLVGMSAAFAV